MLEQRVNVKFCVKLWKSPSEMLGMLETVYGEPPMSKSNVLNGINVSVKAENM
jgi:hypothetical protein